MLQRQVVHRVWDHTFDGRACFAIGPLSGEGVLTEVGWIWNHSAGGAAAQSFALSASPDETEANWRAAMALYSGPGYMIWGKPAHYWRLISSYMDMVFVEPYSVRLGSGANYVLMAVYRALDGGTCRAHAYAIVEPFVSPVQAVQGGVLADLRREAIGSGVRSS